MKHALLHSLGLLALRLGGAGYMMCHGWGKLQMLIGGNFDQFGDPIGIGKTASLVLATGAEFFCSGLVLLGLFTRFAAVPVVITMAVAAFIVHGGDAWTLGGGARSKEPALLFLTIFLALALLGAGSFSLDAKLRGKGSPRPNA